MVWVRCCSAGAFSGGVRTYERVLELTGEGVRLEDYRTYTRERSPYIRGEGPYSYGGPLGYSSDRSLRDRGRYTRPPGLEYRGRTSRWVANYTRHVYTIRTERKITKKSDRS